MEMKNALSLSVMALFLASCSKEERLGAGVETAPIAQRSNYTFGSGKARGTFIRAYSSSNSTIVFNGVITF